MRQKKAQRHEVNKAPSQVEPPTGLEPVGGLNLAGSMPRLWLKRGAR